MSRFIEKLTPVEEALQLLKLHVEPVKEWGDVPVWEANGHVLARDIHAPHDWPPQAKAAYDGYAVRSVDTPGRLAVVGKAEIGSREVPRIGPGEAAYVTTGSFLPDGADTVVPEEYVDEEDGYIIVKDKFEPGMYIDAAGSLVRKGQLLARKGTVLTIEDMAGLAEVAITEVPVYRSLRVAIISMGNELIRPGTPKDTALKVLEGSVIATTGSVIEQFLVDYTPWVEVIDTALLPDSKDTVAWYVERVLPLVDIVLLTGGTGPSRIDMFYQLQESLGGELLFRGLYVIGGKPTSAYIVDGKPIIGLSGYPISALHATIRLVYPLLIYMGNVKRPSPPLPIVRATITDSVKPKRPRPIKVRVEIRNGKYYASPLGKEYQKSSANIGFVLGDGLALTSDRDLEPGDEVDVFLYRAPRGYRHLGLPLK